MIKNKRGKSSSGAENHENVHKDSHDVHVEEEWGQDGVVHGKLSKISSDDGFGDDD